MDPDSSVLDKKSVGTDMDSNSFNFGDECCKGCGLECGPTLNGLDKCSTLIELEGLTSNGFFKGKYAPGKC